jgi:hypothetical protein
VARWKPVSGATPKELEGLDVALDVLNDSLKGFKEDLAATQAFTDAAAQVAAAAEANNPVVSALALVTSTLDNYITDILSTGAYFFPLLPGPEAIKLFMPFSTTSALESFSASLSDRLDSGRPQSSDLGGYSAVAFLGGVNKFQDFASLLYSFKEFIPFQAVTQIAEIISTFSVAELKPGRGYRNTEGAGYDWSSLRVEQIGAVEEALLLVKAAINSAQITLLQPIKDVTRIVRQRINYYILLTQKILAFLSFITNLADLAVNLSALPVSSDTGGVAHMQNAIVNSTNKPDFEYCVGFVVVSLDVSDASSSAFKKFMGVLGVQEDQWD